MRRAELKEEVDIKKVLMIIVGEATVFGRERTRQGKQILSEDLTL